MTDINSINQLLQHNVAEVIDANSLANKLKSGKILRIKLGVDPTSPDLHLGHAVVLWKLKQFQDAGHAIIFLIGDYTTKIGDPSGRNTTRPALTDAEIDTNAQTYLTQVSKILDVSKCEIRRNSEWFAGMTFADIIILLAKVTVAQVIEREDFQNRLKTGADVAMHEIIYPIMQGYDSVQLKADLEMGGLDQKLNLLMGRDLQRKFGQPEQDIMIMPLLIGTDGVKKMSKSLGNYIGITENATEQFGKIMSIPDWMMPDYWRLCTNVTNAELEQIEEQLKSPATNPRDIKLALAKTIVTIYHGAEAGNMAETNFINTFQKGAVPEDLPIMKINLKPTNIVDLLIATKLVESKAEAKRMLDQQAVKIDQQLITDSGQQINPVAGMVIQVGKRKFVKLA